jgi:hypothetical protein
VGDHVVTAVAERSDRRAPGARETEDEGSHVDRFGTRLKNPTP